MNVKDMYCAVKTEGETDVIVFETGQDCAEFCQSQPEYEYLHTGLHSLKSALELFN